MKVREILNAVENTTDKYHQLIVGILIGYWVFSAVTFLGTQRYSDAVKKCVIEQGPNK
jgi:hypothetical protein